MQKTPIQKAEEYLQKAKDILKNTPLADEEHYADAKSVKKAGRTAWKGCITVLQDVFAQKRHDCDKYVHEFDKTTYKEWLSDADNTIVAIFESAFNLLNYTMACDGEKDINVCDRAIIYGEKLLKWCENQLSIMEQQKAEERRKHEEECGKKETEKQYYKEVMRQHKALDELFIS